MPTISPIFEVRMKDDPGEPAFEIYEDGRISGFPEGYTVILNRIPLAMDLAWAGGQKSEVKLGEPVLVREDTPGTIVFRRYVLELHTLYLEKVETLNNRERCLFTNYMEMLSKPPEIISAKMQDTIGPRDASGKYGTIS